MSLRSGFFLLFLCLGLSLSAQEKQEVERRVRPKKVPQLAKSWIKEAFGPLQRVRWYFEETSGENSYEAKLKYKGWRYSVEFSVPGTLEDVEIQRKMKKLDPEVRRNLQSAFDEIEGFQLQRLQEQWSGHPEAVRRAVKTGDLEGVKVLYEVEFIGEVKGETDLWEGVFDQSGKLLQCRHIVLRPSDNLDF